MFELLFGHLYVYFIKYSPLFGEAKTADDCCRCTRTPAQASPTPAPSRASFIIAVAATGVAGEAHNALILRHLLLRNLLVLRPRRILLRNLVLRRLLVRCLLSGTSILGVLKLDQPRLGLLVTGQG